MDCWGTSQCVLELEYGIVYFLWSDYAVNPAEYTEPVTASIVNTCLLSLLDVSLLEHMAYISNNKVDVLLLSGETKQPEQLADFLSKSSSVSFQCLCRVLLSGAHTVMVHCDKSLLV